MKTFCFGIFPHLSCSLQLCLVNVTCRHMPSRVCLCPNVHEMETLFFIHIIKQDKIYLTAIIFSGEHCEDSYTLPSLKFYNILHTSIDYWLHRIKSLCLIVVLPTWYNGHSKHMLMQIQYSKNIAWKYSKTKSNIYCWTVYCHCP